MTHGPALIEFVPYVLGCVSINNILLRTGGGGVRTNLKLLRIGKTFDNCGRPLIFCLNVQSAKQEFFAVAENDIF